MTTKIDSFEEKVNSYLKQQKQFLEESKKEKMLSESIIKENIEKVVKCNLEVIKLQKEITCNNFIIKNSNNTIIKLLNDVTTNELDIEKSQKMINTNKKIMGLLNSNRQ